MIFNGNIFDKSGIPLYQRLLKVASSAQKATASNIANVATPGYAPQSVNFKDEMANALKAQGSSVPATTNPRHISGRPANIIRIKDIGDGDNASGINDVDIETEMSDLAENQMMYEFGAKRLARTFAMLHEAIKGKA
jgi:flagellar basal-body rod protein FlgB